MVLAHGYLDDHHAFDEVAPRLVAAGRRVVLFDQRGHGDSRSGTDGLSPRSMASDYAAVLQHFDVQDGVLVGHSMGAFLSVVFSILHADIARARLRGLVLVGGHAGNVAKGSVQNRLQIAMVKRGVMRLVLSTRGAGGRHHPACGPEGYAPDPQGAGVRLVLRAARGGPGSRDRDLRRAR